MIPENFGNYLLNVKIVEIDAPASIGWFEFAPFWWVMGAVLIAWLTWKLFLVAWQYYYDRAKRDALSALKQIASDDPISLTHYYSYNWCCS